MNLSLLTLVRNRLLTKNRTRVLNITGIYNLYPKQQITTIMGRIIPLICGLLFTNLFVIGQSAFESDVDVLFYLNNKGSFKNEDSGIKLTFSDMGSQLSTGNSQFFQPDVVLLSTSRAIVTYQLVTDPERTVKIVVDSKQNLVMDLSDKAIYRAYSPEVGVKSPSSSKIRRDT